MQPLGQWGFFAQVGGASAAGTWRELLRGGPFILTEARGSLCGEIFAAFQQKRFAKGWEQAVFTIWRIGKAR